MQRIYELVEDNFESYEKTDNITLIEIILYKGRSNGVKKALYKAINDNLALDPGIDCDDIIIVLIEPPLENWGIIGGNPASEIDLGFNIIV